MSRASYTIQQLPQCARSGATHTPLPKMGRSSLARWWSPMVGVPNPMGEGAALTLLLPPRGLLEITKGSLKFTLGFTNQQQLISPPNGVTARCLLRPPLPPFTEDTAPRTRIPSPRCSRRQPKPSSTTKERSMSGLTMEMWPKQRELLWRGAQGDRNPSRCMGGSIFLLPLP
jgi:hypothetical protein